MRASSSDWHRHAGKLGEAPARLPDLARDTRLCGELYGIGRCAKVFTAAQQRTFATYKGRLQVLLKHARDAKDLPIYCITNGQHHFYLLSVFALLLDPEVHVFHELEAMGEGGGGLAALPWHDAAMFPRWAIALWLHALPS